MRRSIGICNHSIDVICRFNVLVLERLSKIFGFCEQNLLINYGTLIRAAII